MLSEAFIKPRYDSGGFAGIPARIENAFAVKKYDAVILLLADAYGWRFHERFQDMPFIKRIDRGGSIEKLTTQFPSTTAAHLTTIHSGLPVGLSGVYEWTYYEPLLDRVISPLPFSFGGDRTEDTLKTTGIEPQALLPKGIFYPALRKLGVKSFSFGLRDFTPSTYSKVITQGAELVPFKTFSEALVNVGEVLKSQSKPTYIQLYYEKIDGMAHQYGPTAPQTEAEVETFLVLMEYYFERIFKGDKRILFMLTSDHGMCEVDPDTTVYLNKDPRFIGIENFIKANQRCELIVPAGSPRDMFLHIKEGMVGEAKEFLEKRLGGIAEVAITEELMADGYFGAEISPIFRQRVGNLVILPKRYQSVWWYEKGKFEQNFRGHHGGLTAEEMEIALYLYEF